MTADILQADEDEEAALWVARHMSNAVDATAFAQWLAGAPGRRETFNALWATCMDDAVADGARLYEWRQNDAPKPSRSGRGLLLGGLVAAACIAALAFSWPQLQFALTPAQSYGTAAGQLREVTLADGSRVTLNGASRISARIAGNRREIALEAGEALFDVHHDEARPFTVTAGAGQVTVLGTRFDLALDHERVDLAVERGLVRFDNESGRAFVHAAQRASLVDGRIAAPVAYDAASSTDWRSGWLQVSDMPLARIVPQLQRWSTRRIVIADPALLGKRVAGRFRLADTAVVLDNLGVLYGFGVRRTDEAFILEPR